MDMSSWYQSLLKPDWAPPAWVFGPVWTFLYVLIIISFSYVGFLAFKKKIGFIILLPFLLNIIFNLLFTPLQFSLHNNVLALLDVILVFLTLIWAMIVIYPFAQWVTWIQIPYLLWVSFAMLLQASITYLNR
ncbi:MAG TPA: tryptophan-rich sensory protein [Oligoflexia bacterium]|nr:tryptophan-rich sensory protein [Oligoflexia bacterium]HMR24667.1 tryptophan-rich sensory protein [Oligoflexia bacterium]